MNSPLLSFYKDIINHSQQKQESKMSTEIHNSDLSDEIYTLESLPQRLREQADKIEKETFQGIMEFEIDICGVIVILDYKDCEKAVII